MCVTYRLERNTNREVDVPSSRDERCYFFLVADSSRAEQPRAWRRSSLLGRGLGVLLGVAVAAGCGSKHPPASSNDNDGTGTSSSSGGIGGSSGGPRKPPGCGQKADGSFCDCIDIPLYADPPNIYFLLDRSGSMSDDGKWDKVRITIADVVRKLGPRANYGATVFPGFAREACAAPKEVMSTRPGDPITGNDGPTTSLLISSTSPQPYGGTPTAVAFRFLLPILRGLSGKTFVILATDGGPNCNPAASCGVDKCIPNIESVQGCPPAGPKNCCAPPDGVPEACLDDVATLSALAAVKSAGFPVYVIGLPGGEVYAKLLDQLATAGGTAQSGATKYFKVDSASKELLLATLRRVAAKIIATCEFRLTTEPADPSHVNVYLDDVIVPKDPTNGWKIEGRLVTLLGASCNRVLNGDALDVRIITGCPTVEPR